MKHILVGFLLLPLFLFSQQDTVNLIPNPSFEDYLRCPEDIKSINRQVCIRQWAQPTEGSIDYFNKCSTGNTKVPRNKMGTQQARTGVAYGGFYASQPHYREYFQTQLFEELIAGATYKLTFYVSLADKSDYAMATLGAVFTVDRIWQSNRDILMDVIVEKNADGELEIIDKIYKPQVLNPVTRMLDDKENWMEITGTFVAQGGERFITIGNFFPSRESNVEMIDKNLILSGAYYYIDDVSLYCIQMPAEVVVAQPQPEQSKGETLEIGQTFVINNVYFDFDKASLQEVSYPELDKVVFLMNKYPNMEVEIKGHTDGKGSAEYNVTLSKNRVKSVIAYLTSQGIESDRLKPFAYGKTLPVADNNTDTGRSKNRRVEFKITSF